MLDCKRVGKHFFLFNLFDDTCKGATRYWDCVSTEISTSFVTSDPKLFQDGD